ncbi:PepSY domain-containing protein [Pedobacter aquae]|uniref:PepSY domain-containing protein n=1 Tax=Pedobacter aquae TaxID=2605747 RepID=A0A5C0VH16_9SPHI|nr:PepSY domain-containing protein [Pedobacter aquae]QEK51202.1 PepSY domain-containing protein [Pedobacter aquae]
MKKYIKQNIYKWHKIIGLITIIPVIFWTLSGLMHPFMAHWFKPTLPKEKLEISVIDTTKIKYSIQEVLKAHQIHRFLNFRIVYFKGNSYYQIISIDKKIRYFNTTTSEELLNGDQHYATYLAKYYLADTAIKPSNISLQTTFSQDYKYINRLLPVWKLSFDKNGGTDLFIETTSSRLATFNNQNRKNFLLIFDLFHNWSFLDAISNNQIRIVMMMICLSIIILSALSGILIYGFMWGKFKKTPINSKSILKKYHRQIGIATAFVTLTFAASGAYHATTKWNPNKETGLKYEPIIKIEHLKKDFLKLNLFWDKLSNISIVTLKKDTLYQVVYNKTDDEPQEILYFNVRTGKETLNADIEYAKYLVKKFTSTTQQEDIILPDCCLKTDENNNFFEAKLLNTKTLYSFSRDYGFVFKRLPVVQLDYDTPQNDTYFIDTQFSTLASHITDEDRIEGYSFAIFHKFLFMDWAGKNIRDFTMLISALGVLIVSLFGLAIFIKK